MSAQVHELLGAEGVTGSGQHKGKFALTPFVAFDTGQIILRGSMDMEVVREALSEEGLFPIAGHAPPSLPASLPTPAPCSRVRAAQDIDAPR